MTYCSMFAQETEPDCGWYGSKTVVERNALFPFNKAKKVVLVSYPDGRDTLAPGNDMRPFRERMDIIKTINFEIGGVKMHTYLILEEVTLSQGWVDQLSHVLVNYTFKEFPIDGILAGALCYQPRNSILFYDDSDAIICCYEICFLCGNGGMWPNPDNLGDNILESCPELIKQLKFIFEKNGIKYGVDEE